MNKYIFIILCILVLVPRIFGKTESYCNLPDFHKFKMLETLGFESENAQKEFFRKTFPDFDKDYIDTICEADFEVFKLNFGADKWIAVKVELPGNPYIGVSFIDVKPEKKQLKETLLLSGRYYEEQDRPLEIKNIQGKPYIVVTSSGGGTGGRNSEKIIYGISDGKLSKLIEYPASGEFGCITPDDETMVKYQVKEKIRHNEIELTYKCEYYDPLCYSDGNAIPLFNKIITTECKWDDKSGCYILGEDALRGLGSYVMDEEFVIANYGYIENIVSRGNSKQKEWARKVIDKILEGKRIETEALIKINKIKDRLGKK